MSSSEGENFIFDDVSGSESEDYAPATKKSSAKVAAPAKATKAAAKSKSSTAKQATKAKAAPKKVLVDHDENAEDSSMDIDDNNASDDSNTGPSVGKAKPSAPAKKKTASETYTKLSQLEHILKRPDSYIGSVETITQAMWTYDSEEKRMVHREVKYVPGFFKIVDEILVNAADNKINDPSMDTLRVNINLEDSTISVYNNGRGIPIEMHSQEKMYIPELIFGHLLSSSNYDDDEKKLTGGRNGYGAKLANIYSHEFIVETADKNTQQKYKQTWTNNMSNCGKPKITKNAKGEEWTKVTFRPDLKRFGMDNIDKDTASLLKKRVFDMAGTVKNVKVFLNDERLKIKTFKQYVDMYVNPGTADASALPGAAQSKQTIVYETVGDRWEVAFAMSEGSFQQVSFANSIATTKGGTHVTYIADQLAKHLVGAVAKRNKAAPVKTAQIKNHMWIFVNALIENPTFDSQTKETLTLPAAKFGTKPALSDDFIKKVQKTPIVDNILNWAKFKADQQIKKTDGSKRSRLLGLTKLCDANNAGTRHAKDCTLILTEGDSAKSLAVAGLGVVGRNNFGVFPLRGKMLNVREAKHDQIMKNEEIQNIKKIMGLQHNKDYPDTTSLRYGRLMIMTDQDHDGSHIKGLIINFLDHFYPSLLKLPDFLVEFVTPIVRVTKGKQRRDFFTIPEYEQWLEDTPDAKRWESKYFKGLGTSTDADARNYFGHMAKHMIPFAPTQDGDRQLIDLAFSKKKADERKEWLRQFKPGTYLDHRLEEIPYSEFINKELILFSMADNIRSIPSVADGLKPGQRKVIWGCFKRKLRKEIKVAQLVGYIAEHAAYHHGEVSLMQTIVNLAQDFVGSNNLNLLKPGGQYGTRAVGGKDHAAARYIFTEPMPLARTIYHPADDNLLNIQKDDNTVIEPEWYIPVVPMVLINGAEGIGTGWSTNIPCYNPIDIVNNIRKLMKGEEQVPMTPWWRGFKGEIKLVAKHKYDVHGCVRKIDNTTVEITELPIHKWTDSYKAELEQMIVGDKDNKEGFVKDYKEHHDNLNVHFIVTMGAKELEKAEKQGLLEFFKLTGKINTSNMMCFDFEGKIKKYDSAEEILDDFYAVRLAYYQKRKDYMANDLQTVFEKYTNQARFVQMIISKELVVSNRKKAEIVIDLRKHKFRTFPKVATAKVYGETEDAEEDEEEAGESSDYDYLLGMPIWSLTKEKIEKLRLQAQEKEAELLMLLEKSPKDLWNADLDKFLVEWERSCEEHERKKNEDANGKVVKRKQATLKTRKSLGGKAASDDDDDFKPIKPAAARRKPAAAKPKPGTKKEDNGDDDDDDDDSDDDEVKTAPSKRKPAASKKLVMDDSDSEVTSKVKSLPKRKNDADEDDDDFIKPAPTKRKAAAAKKVFKGETDAAVEIGEKRSLKSTGKVIVIDSDEDEDEVTKGKGKAKETNKRKSPGTSDDSDDGRPTKKKKAGSVAQAEVTDFFTKAGPSGGGKSGTARKISKSMKPASPPKLKKTVAKKKVVADSDSEDMIDYDDLPAPPARSAPAARAARGAPKKYVDVSDDDGDNDASMFVDDDQLVE
ncbi:DNA topoisomerase [Crucibulum laeve]|uniref:DNA topoisomerase 2 n=1 Tax=Crucibulum laeve TaxID=68775 RepID=A0A5C3M8C1_9AGAR|nr:DNA topoisomerase [Crucibulum laeve]